MRFLWRVGPDQARQACQAFGAQQEGGACTDGMEDVPSMPWTRNAVTVAGWLKATADDSRATLTRTAGPFTVRGTEAGAAARAPNPSYRGIRAASDLNPNPPSVTA
nr:hypothetical protein GCM10010200_053580 [Actinomadura rugatobispora]